MVDLKEKGSREALPHTSSAPTASFQHRKEGLTVDFVTRPRHLHIFRAGYLCARSLDHLFPVWPGGAMTQPRFERTAAESESGAISAEFHGLLAEWYRGESPLSETEFEDQCRELMGRWIELDKICALQWEQRWAVYLLKHSGGGLGESA